MLFIILFCLFVACFLLGMTWMRIGLFNLSGSALENWLRTVTATPIHGMLAGILMTAILQSSSAVTVIAVGLVSARVIRFPQTIGIILGTNIGTTITLEIISFDLSHLIIPLLVIGLIFLCFSNVKLRSGGYILLGIGIIFAAMEGFSWLSTPLTQINVVQELIRLMQKEMYLAFLSGIALTAIIQSSTVVTGIAMSFMGSGIFSLETGILIMIGSNIGTCSTALLAGIGAGNEARLTAYAHLWLNLGGAIVSFPFITHLAHISALLTTHPEMQLAHASVIFNLVCSFIVLPVANQFGQLIEKIHSRPT